MKKPKARLAKDCAVHANTETGVAEVRVLWHSIGLRISYWRIHVAIQTAP